MRPRSRPGRTRRAGIVQGKTYDLASPAVGWQQVMERLRAGRGGRVAEPDDAAHRQPVQVLQRLGQGAFRILITDTYERRCAITREKALPVLEAAHIKPVAEGVAIVSATGKTDFDNGEHYYRLDGNALWVPRSSEAQPRDDLLEWHSDTVFRG